jgi:long-chain acyl-CoA synthetase
MSPPENPLLKPHAAGLPARGQEEGGHVSESYQSLVDLFQKSCERYANHELFGIKEHGGWRYITFREFRDLVDAARGGLAKLGVGAGDRVALIADNRVEWATLAYATYGLGAAFVPMYESQLKEEWRFILNDCGAKVVFVADPQHFESVHGMQPELPELTHVVGLDLKADAEHSYARFMQQGRDNPAPPVQPAADDIAGFIYTSGTTGDPKGVLLSHRNICTNVSGAQDRFPLNNDRSLAFLPWAHSFGQTAELHMMVSTGNSMAINDAVQNIVGNLAEVMPTVLVAVPRIFNRIYDGVHAQMAEKPKIIQMLFKSGISAAVKRNAGEALSTKERVALALADKLIFGKVRAKFGGRLRLVISGSAALSPEVARFIDALGIMIYEGYGLTEVSPVVGANYPGHRKIGSVGLAFPQTRIVIDKSVSQDGEDGEIVVYSPSVMKGYHNRPEENAEVFTADGGLKTGDLGRLDADGYLFITGRIKEQYKLENGKYVVPAPLEEQLKLSPYIANVMVFGDNKPHNVALVVPDLAALEKWASKGGITLGNVAESDAVKRLLEEEIQRLSSAFKGYERPRKLRVITEDFTTENGLLTPSMKVKRQKVIARYQSDIASLY